MDAFGESTGSRTRTLALLPYCLMALLPYCLPARLPYGRRNTPCVSPTIIRNDLNTTLVLQKNRAPD